LKDFERSDPKNNIAMNKKHYQKPAMRVVMLQHQQTLLAGSVDSVNSGDTGIGFGGGGNGPGRARSNGGIDWDDWDE
jgi:hypothetical protein